MFTPLTNELDLVIKAVELALLLILLSYVGLGFVFRLIFKIFKIKISNPKLSKIDNQILDLQLIRLHHGITLERVSEIGLFSEAIASGKVQAPKTWLLPSYLPVGNRKMGKKETWFLYGSATVIAILVSVFSASMLEGQKYNYAEFSNSHGKILVSKIYVYDPTNKRYYNKGRCDSATPKDKEILRTACDYMLTNEPHMKNELENAIRTNNTNFHIIGSIYAMFYIFIICMLIAHPRYYKFNNEFYEFKKEYLRSDAIKNKIVRYKNALKKNTSKS